MTKVEIKDQEFLEIVVKAIVNHPDDVVVERTLDERGVLLTLKVNPEDMGYVIGREGSTAKSIRTLLRIIGVKNNARLNLKIVEPEGGRGPRTEEAKSRGKSVSDVVGDLAL
ncbi:KH domain-containing protein [Patescibacteria group bacterium]|nr:KH domain-containing protein [Patescibacteria group bacterium]MBU4000242.1 KH domain-containing protein [Patescibacteria group bacterium]MBU4057074.1 KH domain-containing protein [Patescibacteria group bacterium]MBU4368774.1 KH domain-containing protein [Patescibacteria group bacterium]